MHWKFVIAGYLIVCGSIALYAAWLVARGRKIAELVPEERRRFLD